MSVLGGNRTLSYGRVCNRPAPLLMRCASEVRSICYVGLAIDDLDVDIARGKFGSGQGKPDLAKVLRTPERAKSVKATASHFVEIDPTARGIGVGAARRQGWCRREHGGGVVGLIEDVVAIAHELLSPYGVVLDPGQVEVGLGSRVCASTGATVAIATTKTMACMARMLIGFMILGIPLRIRLMVRQGAAERTERRPRP